MKLPGALTNLKFLVSAVLAVVAHLVENLTKENAIEYYTVMSDFGWVISPVVEHIQGLPFTKPTVKMKKEMKTIKQDAKTATMRIEEALKLCENLGGHCCETFDLSPCEICESTNMEKDAFQEEHLVPQVDTHQTNGSASNTFQLGAAGYETITLEECLSKCEMNSL